MACRAPPSGDDVVSKVHTVLLAPDMALNPIRLHAHGRWVARGLDGASAAAASLEHREGEFPKRARICARRVASQQVGETGVATGGTRSAALSRVLAVGGASGAPDSSCVIGIIRCVDSCSEAGLGCLPRGASAG